MPSESGRPSWRGDASTRGGALESSGAGKWLALLFCIGLVAAIIALLILPMFRVKTHVVAITTGEVARLGLPPIPFAQEDLFPLEQTQQFEFHRFREVNEGTKLSSLAAELASYDIRPGHILMVYVSAQAAVLNGVPYLLDENFAPAALNESEREAAFRVEELLDQIESSSASEIVVFLDAGNLLSDTRLGVPINLFAIKLQELLKARSSRTWVMLSHSTGEIAQVSYTRQRSFFGESLSDGLLGAADRTALGNEDAKITLAELYAYVRGRVEAASGATQSPLLLRAGVLPEEIPVEDLGFTLTEIKAFDSDTVSAPQTDKSEISFAEPATTAGSEPDVSSVPSTEAPRQEPSAANASSAPNTQAGSAPAAKPSVESEDAAASTSPQ